MRWNDLNGGSIKTLLILALLAVNVAVAHLRHPEPSNDSGSKDPVELTLKAPPRDPSPALGLTTIQNAP
ncbi:MAG TPA: hypothetical protein VNW28_05860 [Chthoniobacterales bacterium]|nr:hypothetical protein [Chthoniobacterales bacterium]